MDLVQPYKKMELKLIVKQKEFDSSAPRDIRKAQPSNNMLLHTKITKKNYNNNPNRQRSLTYSEKPEDITEPSTIVPVSPKGRLPDYWNVIKEEELYSQQLENFEQEESRIKAEQTEKRNKAMDEWTKKLVEEDQRWEREAQERRQKFNTDYQKRKNELTAQKLQVEMLNEVRKECEILHKELDIERKERQSILAQLQHLQTAFTEFSHQTQQKNMELMKLAQNYQEENLKLKTELYALRYGTEKEKIKIIDNLSQALTKHLNTVSSIQDAENIECDEAWEDKEAQWSDDNNDLLE